MEIIRLIEALQRINKTYNCDHEKIVNIYLNYDENSDPNDGHHGVVVGFQPHPGQEHSPDIYERV